MTTIPDEPQDADPAQLDRANEAIDDAKAAAGRVAKDDTIDTDDLPSGQENVPAAPPADDLEESAEASDEESAEASDEESKAEQPTRG